MELKNCEKVDISGRRVLCERLREELKLGKGFKMYVWQCVKNMTLFFIFLRKILYLFLNKNTYNGTN